VLTLPPSLRVYLATEPVDLRRGHDGLCALVRSRYLLDPHDGHLFAFLGRRGDRIKVLYWDRGGFVVWYKRLEQGRFRLPRVPEGAVSVTLDGASLSMLLDGVDLRSVRRNDTWEPRRKTA
jgi:transposase